MVLKARFSLALLLQLSLFSGAAWASDPTATSQNPAVSLLRNERSDEGKGGISLAPVVGYDPTFKFVFGGALFYKNDGFSFGTDFNLNFKQVYQVHLNVSHLFSKRWEYQIHSSNTKGYDPYFGEGGETNPNDAKQLWGIKSSEAVKLVWHTSKIFAVGLSTGVRIRTEEAQEGGDAPFDRYFPNETTGNIGLSAEIDTRDRPQDPLNGFRMSAEAIYVPRALSSIEALKDFGQLEGSFVVYKEILDEILPETIAAVRLMGGYSFGEPSYMYRYAMGGANQMQGYLDNRFRGKQYYMQQTELRFPIFKALSGVLSMGFGDIADAQFTNPKLSYGGGIRIGLPPDYINKIRIDFAFGRDQSTISANFGQTF